jgi:hypothetical protein
MHATADQELLRRYVEHGAEEAFTTLVPDSIQRSNLDQPGVCERRWRISASSFRPRAGLPQCWRATKRASA